MDPRLPAYHQAAIRLLMARAVAFEEACALLTTSQLDTLTYEQVLGAMAPIETDAANPVRSVVLDLARLASGALPTDDIPAVPQIPRVYRHVGS